MQVQDHHVKAGQLLPPDERSAYYTALVEYLWFGVKPELSGAPAAVFEAIVPELDKARARARAGALGGAMKKVSK